LLLQPKATSGLPLWPALLASASWAFGSIFRRRLGTSGNLVMQTALQMLFGGAFLAIEALLFGQFNGFDVHAVSASSLAGFVWLVLFGSIIAYSAYLYTMQAASTALASTYAYVNPVVAVIIGMLLFHEHLTVLESVAATIILVGVALMMIPKRAPARV
ncbi:MAG: EamA family transporter, partial [Candidatus Eremiobacteraeota bacterium]|nr:EamA family transporter [Candidatus Eremiobacteraeota bacterium]